MAAKLLKTVKENAVLYIAAVLLSGALLWLVHSADDAALRVMLWPHAKAAGIFYHMDMRYVAGIGYTATDASFAIGRACMGVGFVVMMLSMLVFVFTHRLRGFGRKGVWLALAFVLSAVVGVVVSCIRIVGSVPFVHFEKFATLHTATGAVLYLAALVGVYLAAGKILGGLRNEKVG